MIIFNGYSVFNLQAVLSLKAVNSAFHSFPVNTVHMPFIIPQLFKLSLHFIDICSPVSGAKASESSAKRPERPV